MALLYHSISSSCRATIERWTLGLYPGLLKVVMAVFDLPEAMAVGRARICTHGAPATTRVEAAGYYLGSLAYYWVLATPTVALLFGVYLYISINWLYIHFDEAFSALRVEDFKARAGRVVCRGSRAGRKLREPSDPLQSTAFRALCAST